VLGELGVVEQRYRAVLEVLDEGVAVTMVARRHGVAQQAVHQWLRRYASGAGLGGLADRPPKPKSCPHQMPVVEARSWAAARASGRAVRIHWQLEHEGIAPLPGRSIGLQPVGCELAALPLQQGRPRRRAALWRLRLGGDRAVARRLINPEVS
jgi:transposase-like protein